jgi:AraC-like DNA-binding protein
MMRPKSILTRQYGLTGERYPFRPRPGHAGDTEFLRLEANLVLLGIDAMIYARIRARMQRHVDDHSVDDIAQRCRAHLWSRCLPAFDTGYKVKLGTYLYRCIDNFVRSEHQILSRRLRRAIASDPELMGQSIPAPDSRLDHHVEALAEDIRANPERYLSPRQAKVLRSRLARPAVSVNDLARSLGYSHASNLSLMLRRIMERIAAINIEDGPSGRPGAARQAKRRRIQ